MTPDQLKAQFRQRGETITQWAKQHGYPRREVYRVLNGQAKGHYGQAREIAVKLGLEEDHSRCDSGFLVDQPIIGLSCRDTETPASTNRPILPQSEQLQAVLTTLTVTSGHALAALKRDDLVTLDSHLATLQDMLDLARGYRHSKRLLSVEDCMEIAQSNCASPGTGASAGHPHRAPATAPSTAPGC